MGTAALLDAGIRLNVGTSLDLAGIVRALDQAPLAAPAAALRAAARSIVAWSA